MQGLLARFFFFQVAYDSLCAKVMESDATCFCNSFCPHIELNESYEDIQKIIG